MANLQGYVKQLKGSINNQILGVKWLILLPIVRKLHLIGLNNENENKPKAKSKTKQN